MYVSVVYRVQLYVEMYTCVTIMFFPLPEKWNNRGVYSSGLTLLKPESAPPDINLSRDIHIKAGYIT